MWMCLLYHELFYILFKYWWHVWSSFKCASEAINNKCALTLWSSCDVKPQNWPKRGMKTLSAATNQPRMTSVLEFFFISIHYKHGKSNFFCYRRNLNGKTHGLRVPREEIALTSWPKINSHSQIFRYGQNIFCLPHPRKFSDFFDTYQQCFSFSFYRK